MNEILVNDEETVNGSFTFDVEINETVSPPIYSITGVFTTKEKYFEELHTLQNERYRIERVKVYRETYGSDEDDVVYYFTAGRFGRNTRRDNE